MSQLPKNEVQSTGGKLRFKLGSSAPGITYAIQTPTSLRDWVQVPIVGAHHHRTGSEVSNGIAPFVLVGGSFRFYRAAHIP